MDDWAERSEWYVADYVDMIRDRRLFQLKDNLSSRGMKIVEGASEASHCCRIAAPAPHRVTVLSPTELQRGARASRKST